MYVCMYLYSFYHNSFHAILVARNTVILTASGNWMGFNVEIRSFSQSEHGNDTKYVFHSFLFRVSHSMIYSILMCACTLSRFSHIWLFATPWTAGHQAPLSMEFSRQEYEVGCYFLLQGIFLTQGLKLCSL